MPASYHVSRAYGAGEADSIDISIFAFLVLISPAFSFTADFRRQFLPSGKDATLTA